MSQQSMKIIPLDSQFGPTTEVGKLHGLAGSCILKGPASRARLFSPTKLPEDV
jgi:hypothetical protein